MKKQDSGSAETQPTERAVVVTTAHKGVFFGYTVDKGDAKTITLTRARMAVRWSSNMRGVVGLAALGPDHGCRIGPAAPAIQLQDVTAVMEVTAKAVTKWEGEPWA